MFCLNSFADERCMQLYGPAPSSGGSAAVPVPGELPWSQLKGRQSSGLKVMKSGRQACLEFRRQESSGLSVV